MCAKARVRNGAGINISRVLQGGGYYIGAPTVDLAEVGAGGGSIAWLDAAGMLKVGPAVARRSASRRRLRARRRECRRSRTLVRCSVAFLPIIFLGGEQLDVVHARNVLAKTTAKTVCISVEEACAATG